jgi:predicted O-methyltransferase YrrM
METPEEAGAHLNKLHEAVWQLAAVALFLRDPSSVDPDLRRSAGRVVVEAGLGSDDEGGTRSATGLRQLIEQSGGDATRTASQAAAPILQAAALLSGVEHWASQDDEALLAQGRASAQGAGPFKMFGVPMMAGLGELLAGPSPVMLDVGTGVAAMAVAFCEAFPGLRVVGLDLLDRALELARRTVADAGMGNRIELRHQDVAELDDREVFCLAWLPAPFIPPAAIEAGLPRILKALTPGGWLMVGHGKFGGDPLSDEITRLQTVAFGGTALDNDEAEDLLRNVGLELVATAPTPEGAPAITIGRLPLK